MKDEILEKEFFDYILDENGKIIPQRTLANVLDKRGYKDYLLQRYDDLSATTEKEKLAEALYRITNNIERRPLCKTCGKSLRFNYGARNYSSYCNPACRNANPEVLAKNKAGVKKALNEYYANPDNLAYVNEKKKQVFKEKYGVDTTSAFGIKDVQDKAKQTVLSRYGVDNVFRIPEYRFANSTELPKQQAKALWLSRGFDVDYDGDNVIIHNGCPVHGDIILPHAHWNNRMKPERRQNHMICPLCHPIGYHSGFEVEVMNYLDTLGLEYSKNDRTVIKPLELDFVFGNNVAIEVNGIYYHNVDHKPEGYHKSKQDAAVNAGYDLLQIWEHDFANRRIQCINYIDDFLGLNKPIPDNAVFSVIDYEIAEDFRKCCSLNVTDKYDTCIGIVDERGSDIYGIAYLDCDGNVIGIVADIGIDWTSVFDKFIDHLERFGSVKMIFNYENVRLQHIKNRGYDIVDWIPGKKWFDNNGPFEEVVASINPCCFEFETAGVVTITRMDL